MDLINTLSAIQRIGLGKKREARAAEEFQIEKVRGARAEKEAFVERVRKKQLFSGEVIKQEQAIAANQIALQEAEELSRAKENAAEIKNLFEAGRVPLENAEAWISHKNIQKFASDADIKASTDFILGKRSQAFFQQEVGRGTFENITPENEPVVSNIFNRVLAQLPPDLAASPGIQAIEQQLTAARQTRLATEQAIAIRPEAKPRAAQYKQVPDSTSSTGFRWWDLTTNTPSLEARPKESLTERLVELDKFRIFREQRAEEREKTAELRRRAATAEDKFNVARVEINNLVQDTKALFDAGGDVINDAQLMKELSEITGIVKGETLREHYQSEINRFLDRGTASKVMEAIAGLVVTGGEGVVRRAAGEPRFVPGEPPQFQAVPTPQQQEQRLQVPSQQAISLPTPQKTRAQTTLDSVTNTTSVKDLSLSLKELIKDKGFTTKEKKEIREAIKAKLKELGGK
jgi:hypothetical protein